jgi:hypothetical protein
VRGGFNQKFFAQGACFHLARESDALPRYVLLHGEHDFRRQPNFERARKPYFTGVSQNTAE